MSAPPSHNRLSALAADIRFAVGSSRRAAIESLAAAIQAGAKLAAALEPELRAEAKERQRESEGRGKKGGGISPTFLGRALDYLARIVGKDRKTIVKARARIHARATVCRPVPMSRRRDAGTVARAFPVSRRRDNLSFSFHAEVAGMADEALGRPNTLATRSRRRDVAASGAVA
jgi:hypothetical protein